MKGQCIHCEFMSQKGGSLKGNYICPQCDFLMESGGAGKLMFVDTL